MGGAPTIATPDRGTPGSGRVAPSPPGTTPKANPPVRFTPVTVQAENPANTLSEGALPVSCDTCDGGARVRYLGRVTVYLDTNVAGTRTVTVTYEIDGNRRVKVAINNAAPSTFSTSGTDWKQPKTFSFVAPIPAGRTAITFYNDEGDCPDIDKVTVS
ncbi:hypothetical protein C7C45_28285 [Micromonospora arborensis]|uniref:CBM6 domain-containing protein n=1 Tax=Micromonospora arborensis TaxID=2116518 RepID=A0A318NM92_9ACTN|nr:hypothetical protein C7C45_28285 [Micromonospora arborensis]